jgi:hypothetical protein
VEALEELLSRTRSAAFRTEILNKLRDVKEKDDSQRVRTKCEEILTRWPAPSDGRNGEGVRGSGEPNTSSKPPVPDSTPPDPILVDRPATPPEAPVVDAPPTQFDRSAIGQPVTPSAGEVLSGKGGGGELLVEKKSILSLLSTKALFIPAVFAIGVVILAVDFFFAPDTYNRTR